VIKRSHKRRKRNAPEDSTRAKGDIVEQIVASMHEAPNVEVERNVFLFTQDGSGRTREIDVLLSGQVAGYPVHVAIECKNEDKPTGVGQIDEFVGKLEDVGIPTQLGIFVTASRYTSDATLRAEEAGITPLVLKDVTEELSHSVVEAFQSVIYLLLTITSIRVENDIGRPAPAGEILFFRDQDGKLCGSVPDLVWWKWHSGEIPTKLGPYQIEMGLPDGWLQIIQGQVAQVSRICVDVQVTGHMVTFLGSVRQHELVRASDKEVDKWQAQARFDRPTGTLPVTTLSTEDDLRKCIGSAEGITLTIGRFRLPRLRWGPMYWPPSESTMKKILELLQKSIERGETFDLASLDLTEIEGNDMQKVWEPILPDHPFANSLGDQESAGLGC
jgi:hypothetical protein